MSWSQSEEWELTAAQRKLRALLTKRNKQPEDLLEMAALQLKINQLENRKKEGLELERQREEADRLRKELERQRKEMRRRIIESGFAKFFKKARPQVEKLVVAMIKSAKTEQLNSEIENAIEKAYEVKVKVDIQKEMLANKAYWAEMAFYLIMPEAKMLKLERERFAALTDIPIFGRIVKWYKRRKNERKYQDLYRSFESKVMKHVTRYAIWFTARLSDLALVLQKVIKKSYKTIALGEDVRLTTTMGKAHSRVVAMALLSLADDVAPDAQVSHEGIKFKKK